MDLLPLTIFRGLPQSVTTTRLLGSRADEWFLHEALVLPSWR